VSCGLASGNALGFAVDMVLVLVIFVRTKGSLPLMETGLARPLDLGWKKIKRKAAKFENLQQVWQFSSQCLFPANNLAEDI
jgi:hypothetical protein